MPAAQLSFDAPPLWRWISVEDPTASRFYDGHYSRQTTGARGLLAPGRRFLLWHDGEKGPALWGVVLNLDPAGALRWRNSIFRNASGTLSSDLIAAATEHTYSLWRVRYGGLPSVPLRTEVEIDATAARRSRRSQPGHCYLMAGWTKTRDIPPGHGRPAKVELEAPRSAP